MKLWIAMDQFGFIGLFKKNQIGENMKLNI